MPFSTLAVPEKPPNFREPDTGEVSRCPALPRSYALGSPQRGHSLLRVSYVLLAVDEG